MKKSNYLICSIKIPDNVKDFDQVAKLVPENFSFEKIEEREDDLLELEYPSFIDIFKGVGKAYKESQKFNPNK